MLFWSRMKWSTEMTISLYSEIWCVISYNLFCKQHFAVCWLWTKVSAVRTTSCLRYFLIFLRVLKYVVVEERCLIFRWKELFCFGLLKYDPHLFHYFEKNILSSLNYKLILIKFFQNYKLLLQLIVFQESFAHNRRRCSKIYFPDSEFLGHWKYAPRCVCIC